MLLSGVALITHGWGGSATGWVTAMADAAVARTSIPSQTSVWTLAVTNSSSPTVSSAVLNAGPNRFTEDYNGETVIKLDWSALSTTFFVSTTDVAAAVADYFLNTAVGGMTWLDGPIHMVGHSRGASVISEIARVIGNSGVWVDQLTWLDPHPVTGFPYYDPNAAAYENIVFADNYYQDDDFPDGGPVAGSFQTNLTGMLTTQGYSSAHSDVHLWHHGTIDTSPSASDGDQAVPTDWYDNLDLRHGPRDQVGFNYSRLGGDASEWGDGVTAEGLHSALGGSGARVSLDLSGATWPNVLDVRINDGLTYDLGDDVHVGYHYQDADSAAEAQFYFDLDRNPYNGNETLLLQSALPQTGTAVIEDEAALATTGLPLGDYFVFAEVTDSTHSRYAYAENPISIVDVAPPVVVASSVDGYADLGGYVVPPESGDYRADAIWFEFSEDVVVQVGDLVLSYQVADVGNPDGGFLSLNPVNPDSFALNYDPGAHRATWTFPGSANGFMADGRYELKLLSGGVADVSGNPLDGDGDGSGGDDYQRTFVHAIPGDTNFDGAVDLLDLATLSGNWQQPGDWTNGRTSGTALVDLLDLATLSGQWQFERPGGSWDIPIAAPVTFGADGLKCLGPSLRLGRRQHDHAAGFSALDASRAVISWRLDDADPATTEQIGAML